MIPWFVRGESFRGDHGLFEEKAYEETMVCLRRKLMRRLWFV